MGQPLREAVSWNVCINHCIRIVSGQPLREAVSWNDIKLSQSSLGFCQPLREAVSWNNYIWGGRGTGKTVSLFVRLWVEITVEKFSMSDIRCQPLREAVSWNMTCDTLYLTTTRSSASSWGCKLKYEQSYGYKFRITGNCRENFAWKNSVNGIVQCLRPVRNDHGFVALLYGSGHQSCLLRPRHGRTTAMKYVRNRCRR